MNAQAFDIAPEQALLERCRAGETGAWKALYDAHFDFVHRTCRRLGLPSSEVEDAAQETFVVAFRRLADFHHGRLDTWLFRIAANVVSGRHRRRKVRDAFARLFGRAEDEVDLAPSPEAGVAARDAQRLVAELLARMAPKKREVFALYELEGLSGEEISERLGCKVDTVWTRLHYARKEFEALARKRGWEP